MSDTMYGVLVTAGLAFTPLGIVIVIVILSYLLEHIPGLPPR